MRIFDRVPYQELSKAEIEQPDTLIRTAYKAALGLPSGTSTDRLLALGIYSTFEELRAAVLISQRERLSLTPLGGEILRGLGYPVRPQYSDEDLPFPLVSVRSSMLLLYRKT